MTTQPPPSSPEAPVQPAPSPTKARRRHDRPESLQARLASPDELADWDAHTVASPNGHVYQSLAWGEYRAAHGRPVWHLVFDDGFRMLVVGRDRPVVGGGWAYATRGPIPEADAALTAARAAKAAELLADEGLDSFTVDGETPAASGLGALLQVAGFRAVEEVQTLAPSDGRQPRAGGRPQQRREDDLRVVRGDDTQQHPPGGAARAPGQAPRRGRRPGRARRREAPGPSRARSWSGSRMRSAPSECSGRST